MSKVKLFTDGTPEGTLIYDQDGKKLNPVKSVNTALTVKEGVAKFTFEIVLAEDSALENHHVPVLFNGEWYRLVAGGRTLAELKSIFKLDPGYELYYLDPHADPAWQKVKEDGTYVFSGAQFVSQAPSGGSA